MQNDIANKRARDRMGGHLADNIAIVINYFFNHGKYF